MSTRRIATLVTNYGTIQFELLPEDAPRTVENFTRLANRGYYTNVTFHRVIRGFMIQGGDPTGTGAGGESAFGGEFEDEINPASPLYQTGYVPGIVAMANRGPNTNGSQFFIMHKKCPLPPNYTIFGRVISGQEVVDAIAETPTNAYDRPLEPVIIQSARVEEVPLS
jgi:cyclophilin family peptidyl-prolyl cis-trans isomerase